MTFPCCNVLSANPAALRVGGSPSGRAAATYPSNRYFVIESRSFYQPGHRVSTSWLRNMTIFANGTADKPGFWNLTECVAVVRAYHFQVAAPVDPASLHLWCRSTAHPCV